MPCPPPLAGPPYRAPKRVVEPLEVVCVEARWPVLRRSTPEVPVRIWIAVAIAVVIVALLIGLLLRRAQQRRRDAGREQAVEGRSEARLEHLEADRREAEAEEHAA